MMNWSLQWMSKRDSFNAFKEILFFSLIFVGLLFIRWLVNFNGLYGQDAHEYFRFAGRLLAYFKEGALPGDYFWSVNYPLYGAGFALIFGHLRQVLQVVSLVSFVLSGYYFMGILNSLYPSGGGKWTYTLSTFVLSPFLFRAGFLIMSDMLTLLFILMAFHYGIRFLKEERNVQFLVSIFAIASAVMTRYAAAMLILLLLLRLNVALLRQRRWNLLFGGIILSNLVFLPHYLIRSQQPLSFLHHPWLLSWSPINYLKSSFVTIDGFASYRFPNFLYMIENLFHPHFIWFGLFLFPFLSKNMLRGERGFLLQSALLYIFFLGGIPYQNPRFLILSFPLIAVWLFPGFRKILSTLKHRGILRAVVVAVIIVVQALFIYRYGEGIVQLNHLEKWIAQVVKSRPEKVIYSFEMDGALATYGCEKQVVNLWSHKLSKLKTPALLIFNLPKFRKQWAGRNPMLNWELIRQKYSLQEIRSFENGWKLYRITN